MESKEALSALSALGHDTRLRLFRRLVQAGPAGLWAGALAEAAGLRPNTASTNLSILAAAGLVTATREGRAVRYRADMAGMQALLAFLMEDCCGGRHELCAPGVERIGRSCGD